MRAEIMAGNLFADEADAVEAVLRCKCKHSVYFERLYRLLQKRWREQVGTSP